MTAPTSYFSVHENWCDRNRIDWVETDGTIDGSVHHYKGVSSSSVGKEYMLHAAYCYDSQLGTRRGDIMHHALPPRSRSLIPIVAKLIDLFLVSQPTLPHAEFTSVHFLSTFTSYDKQQKWPIARRPIIYRAALYRLITSYLNPKDLS